MRDAEELKGKVVLITGSAQRIGAETARTLHAHGANVVIHYRSSRQPALRLQEELNRARPDSVVIIQADLLEVGNLPALVREASMAWGRLDALVNNASTFYPTPVGTVNEQQWNDLMGTNLKTPFFLSQAAAPLLARQRGAIVNIVDIHGERPLKGHPVYSTAKAGLIMLTKALAAELGPEVRVNAVAPGAILWPESDLDDLTKQRIVSRTFLKRQGSPADIARAVAFLIGNAQYMTGQVLVVDGGRSLNS